MTRHLMLVILCVACARSGLAATGERSKPVAMNGLKPEMMWMTHMGCLTGCAKYLKVPATAAWIYGGCGHAFALNIHTHVCPSGPTAWCAEKCDELAANVGLAVTRHEAQKSDKSKKQFAKKKEQIWRKTREAIAAGRPCFGWELDVPEWYVLTGCDAEGNYLFDKWGKPAKKPRAKLGESEIGWACVNVVRPTKAADDRKTVREALRFAVDHGAGKHSHEAWTAGLGAYDQWIKALGNAKMIATDKVVGFGQAYNAQCWAECRRFALAFLKEARKRLADEKLRALFDEAIGRYATVSKNLTAVAKAFPFTIGDQKGMVARIRDVPRREKAARAFRAAKAAEQAGLKTLAKIAKALGAERVKSTKAGAGGK